VVVVLALAVGVVLLSRDDAPELAGSTPPGRAQLVDPGDIVSGGPPPDGIPPVDRPRFQAVGEVDWLARAEPVAMVELDGQAKAYPLQILVWHEIVNDQVGGVPVAVTYCPLCNTAISFRRPVINGAATSFGTSGKLYKSNLVMYDRATKSLWPQALGQAVTGALTGRQLGRVTTQLVAFTDFRTAFPDARVLSRDTGHQRPYGQNPYPLYDRDGSQPFLFDGRPDGRLPAVARVLGLSAGGRHLAVPYPRLAGRAQHGVAAANLELAGTPLLVVWRSGATSALDRRSIAGSRDVGAAAAFSRQVGGWTLTFHAPAGTSPTARPAAAGTSSAGRRPGRWPAPGWRRPRRWTRSGSTGPPSTPTPPSGQVPERHPNTRGCCRLRARASGTAATLGRSGGTGLGRSRPRAGGCCAVGASDLALRRHDPFHLCRRPPCRPLPAAAV